MNPQTFVARCRSIFSDNAGTRREGAKHSGPFVDEGRLGMLAVNDLRVFAKRVHRQFKQWAIHCLVDCSGSIERHHRTHALVETTCNIYEALRAANVGSATLSGFNAAHIPLDDLLKDRPAFESMLYRAHHEPRGSGYANHDGYYVRAAARKLASMAAYPGKVLLVFSDGNPSCDQAGDRHTCGEPGCVAGGSHGQRGLRADLVAALAEARRMGIITLGVGIQAKHVSEFYGEAHSTSVDNLDEMFSKASALLERHIIRG